ncbi:Ribonuclease H-like superfamily [Sesbania bispinosa]|nr:Ribonuclease H-like superfamily [Sesbania bispinosa]
MCYEIWQARNKKVFEQRDTSLQTLLNRVSNSLQTGERSNPHLGGCPRSAATRVEQWSPPPIRWFKVNVDAAHAAGEVWGVGIIIRDEHGVVLAAASRRISSLPDPGLAEAMGIRLAILFAVEMCFDRVVVESDCKTIVEIFQSNSLCHSYQGMIIQDCITLSRCFSSFQIKHVRRAGNMCAHLLAKYGCSHPENNWIEENPHYIALALAQDNLSTAILI